ncbi:hypothetical protein ElyMa_000897600 [Elysia marginata]|uniref:Uncharacterized protein n=1 Tax=Elysia marginata TaxID=1093978 RepID=A0AAV4H764_9GAST|nr:hypothetical protein ElyMa_000897600 [Elysia marginata]
MRGVSRLLNSLKTGSLPNGDGNLLGDDSPSGDTGDTDLKSPCLARRNLTLLARHETASPVSHARAPLLQAHGSCSPPADWFRGTREATRAGRDDANNQLPKIHRKKLKATDSTQSKGNNSQKRSSSKRHSVDVMSRRNRSGDVSPRKRKSASGALGRENSGFGEDEQQPSGHGAYTAERHLSYQGDCCSSGACGCNSVGAVGDQHFDRLDTTGDGSTRPDSVPIGYGTLHTSGTPKASVEVILKSASDGNMVRV